MDSEQLQIFALLSLHALQPHGSREADLLVRARSTSWPALAPLDLRSALLALEAQQFVQRYTPALSAERWIITELGAALLQRRGLA